MPVNYVTKELTPQEIFRIVSPSVYVVRSGSTEFAIEEGEGFLGSAVAISRDVALTNCHVIENQPVIRIVDNNRKPMIAVLAQADKRSDRCLLRVDGVLNPVTSVRRIQELSVGERVYTIGNPSGLTKTLGEGLISGLRRDDNINYVQTTAQISRGSSGGALVDAKGSLVGITTFLLKDAQNLNFAIAAEEYRR
jgi:S1-C subfamily serine protease